MTPSRASGSSTGRLSQQTRSALDATGQHRLASTLSNLPQLAVHSEGPPHHTCPSAVCATQSCMQERCFACGSKSLCSTTQLLKTNTVYVSYHYDKASGKNKKRLTMLDKGYISLLQFAASCSIQRKTSTTARLPVALPCKPEHDLSSGASKLSCSGWRCLTPAHHADNSRQLQSPP